MAPVVKREKKIKLEEAVQEIKKVAEQLVKSAKCAKLYTTELTLLGNIYKRLLPLLDDLEDNVVKPEVEQEGVKKLEAVRAGFERALVISDTCEKMGRLQDAWNDGIIGAEITSTAVDLQEALAAVDMHALEAAEDFIEDVDKVLVQLGRFTIPPNAKAQQFVRDVRREAELMRTKQKEKELDLSNVLNEYLDKSTLAQLSSDYAFVGKQREDAEKAKKTTGRSDHVNDFCMLKLAQLLGDMLPSEDARRDALNQVISLTQEEEEPEEDPDLVKFDELVAGLLAKRRADTAASATVAAAHIPEPEYVSPKVIREQERRAALARAGVLDPEEVEGPRTPPQKSNLSKEASKSASKADKPSTSGKADGKGGSAPATPMTRKELEAIEAAKKKEAAAFPGGRMTKPAMVIEAEAEQAVETRDDAFALLLELLGVNTFEDEKPPTPAQVKDVALGMQDNGGIAALAELLEPSEEPHVKQGAAKALTAMLAAEPKELEADVLKEGILARLVRILEQKTTVAETREACCGTLAKICETSATGRRMLAGPDTAAHKKQQAEKQSASMRASGNMTSKRRAQKEAERRAREEAEQAERDKDLLPNALTILVQLISSVRIKNRVEPNKSSAEAGKAVSRRGAAAPDSTSTPSLQEYAAEIFRMLAEEYPSQVAQSGGVYGLVGALASTSGDARRSACAALSTLLSKGLREVIMEAQAIPALSATVNSDHKQAAAAAKALLAELVEKGATGEVATKAAGVDTVAEIAAAEAAASGDEGVVKKADIPALLELLMDEGADTTVLDAATKSLAAAAGGHQGRQMIIDASGADDRLVGIATKQVKAASDAASLHAARCLVKMSEDADVRECLAEPVAIVLLDGNAPQKQAACMLISLIVPHGLEGGTALRAKLKDASNAFGHELAAKSALAPLLALLAGTDPKDRATALLATRALVLHCDDDFRTQIAGPVLTEVADPSPLLTELVDLVKEGAPGQDKLIMWALETLAALTSLENKRRKIVESMLAFVKAGKPASQLAAARVLQYICTEGPAPQAVLGETARAKACPICLDVYSSKDAPPELKEAAGKLLITLTTGLSVAGDNCAAAVKKGGVDILLNALEMGTERERDEAAVVLGNLAYHDEDAMERVLSAGGAKHMVDVLFSPGCTYQTELIGALSTLCRSAPVGEIEVDDDDDDDDDDDGGGGGDGRKEKKKKSRSKAKEKDEEDGYTDTNVHRQVIAPIIRKLQRGQDREKRTAAEATRVLAGNAKIKEQLIMQSGASALTGVASASKEPAAKAAAADALLALAVSDANKGEVVRAGAIPVMLALVRSGDEVCIGSAALLLFTLAGVDDYARMIRDGGGVEALQDVVKRSKQRRLSERVGKDAYDALMRVM